MPSQSDMAPEQEKPGFSRFFHSLANRVDSIFKTSGNGVLAAADATRGGANSEEPYVMKNANGSETTVNAAGLITKFRDAEGRQWSFSYRGRDVSAILDPQGRAWVLTGKIWNGPAGSEPPLAVHVDHSHAIIAIERSQGKMIYRPDGTTSMEIERQVNGRLHKVRYTEFATRPCRAFMVSEQVQGTNEKVTYIRDSNSKFFRFEYEGDSLVRYSDISGATGTVWHAERDAAGVICRWQATDKLGGNQEKVMMPCLEAVDPAGNRHFRGADGAAFVVRPSGAAFFPRPQLAGQDNLARTPEQVMPRYFNSFML